MFRFTRSKSTRDKAESSRQTKPTPSRRRCDADSDSEDEESFYDPAAASLERELGFRIPTGRMLRRINLLRQRKFDNTKQIDWNTMEAFGVAEDLQKLTRSVGFRKKFWARPHKAYKKQTMEFLASLQLKTDPNTKGKYIKFRLTDKPCNMKIESIREIFGFDKEPETDESHFREGWNKHIFWEKISGLRQARDYKARLIQHPVIRLMQRVLASTIFARGETVSRLNNEDAHLLDNMLREQPAKPDLAILMVKHWLKVAEETRSGGTVTMGAYVTRLASVFDFVLPPGEQCKGPDLLTPKIFDTAKFLTIETERSTGDEQYLWYLDGRQPFYLPFVVPFEISDQSTWLVPMDYAGPIGVHPPHAAGHEETQQEQPQQMQEDYTYAGTSYAGPSQQPPPVGFWNAPPATWYGDISDKLGRVLTLQESQGDEMREVRRLSEDNSQRLDSCFNRFDRIDTNLATMQQEQYDQRFFMTYNYWPGGDDDPNLYPQPPHGGDGSSSH